MSLGDNKVLNGPEGEITMAFNQPTAMSQETSKVVTGSGSHPRPPPHPQQHPPLQRVDSRAYLQQQQQQYQQQPRPPTGFRPPIGGRPLQFPPSGNPQFRPPLPVRPLRPPQLRPGAPRPPPPPSPRPQLFTPSSRQSSVEESTRTLDPERSDDALPPEERPPMKGRSFSLCSNPELPAYLDNARRQSVSSIGSVEDVSGRRMDELPPSRPDSRAQQHLMSKIEENEEKAAPPPQAPSTIAAASSSPPTTLPLATADAKQSNSPSPQQPDSVIENKPPQSVPPIEITDKEKTSNHQTTPSTVVTPSPSPSNLSPPKKEGDNDSGVDESTQGNVSNSYNNKKKDLLTH
ncbi:PREDICTED: proline-rich protein 2-like isoform X2 [Nicrophorus vespilloides]|uniref:Proline-rich protein 2-like isoform X2 n=1 Tax=Nicrophorus vespilloides TaxID=110193 RepID=A0ABM1MV73_NICVS|nr:PREDICTED: proline-rich protein 2-like isoform X2 [Nicrophorus vespilloides]